VAVVVAATAGLDRRLALLALLPIGQAIGLPWPGAAAVFLLVDRLVARVRRSGGTTTPAGPVPLRHPTLVTAAVGVAATSGAAVLALVQLRTTFPVIEVDEPPSWWAVTIAVVALAAVNATCEELVWRYRLLGLLSGTRLGVVTAVSVQGISFGVAHTGGLPGGVVGGVGAGVLGLVLGVLRVRTGTLRGCVLVHLCIDLVLFALVADHLVFVPRGAL
jgi:membrane protease YdiL (CAAX protease family)